MWCCLVHVCVFTCAHVCVRGTDQERRHSTQRGAGVLQTQAVSLTSHPCPTPTAHGFLSRLPQPSVVEVPHQLLSPGAGLGTSLPVGPHSSRGPPDLYLLPSAVRLGPAQYRVELLRTRPCPLHSSLRPGLTQYPPCRVRHIRSAQSEGPSSLRVGLVKSAESPVVVTLNNRFLSQTGLGLWKENHLCSSLLVPRACRHWGNCAVPRKRAS